MATRLGKLEKKMKEEKQKFKKLRIEVEEFLRKEIASNFSNHVNALTNPSFRDLPIVLISAYQSTPLTSPQTVTFDSFLANFNNANSPGGGKL